MSQRLAAGRPFLALLLVIAAAAAITGCGAGAGPGTRDASVLVTSDFGAHRIGQATERRVPGAETVMSLLQRHFHVGTRYGGGFVESISGHSGNAHRVDWFYFVNGIQADQGAAATDIHAGDRVWWDLHSWVATQSIPAVVGSYPAPFTTGIDGARSATVRECATGMRVACELVGASLLRNGVTSPEQGFHAKVGPDAQAVVVGAWSQIRRLAGAGVLAAGPGQSGVYAQFLGGGGGGSAAGGGSAGGGSAGGGAAGGGSAGAKLGLDNPLGAVVQTLRASVGLIAATQGASAGHPTWFVTGTDAAGVRAAARAFTAAKLDGHFAVAVDGTRVISLPVDAS